MSVLFKERFRGIGTQFWTPVINLGGPIYEQDSGLHIQGSGITADNLGIWLKLPNTNGVSTNGCFVTVEVQPPPTATDLICMASIGLASGLDYANCVSIIGVSETPSWKLHDYGGNAVAGGSTLSEFYLGEKYCLKFQFNNDGTVTGYIQRHGQADHNLGTTSIAADLDHGSIYVSLQQTLIAPESHATKWTNLFFQNDGVDFDYASVADDKMSTSNERTNYQKVDEETTAILGTTGGIGDYIEAITFAPQSLDPQDLNIQDGDDEVIPLFIGGTGSVTSLVPITIPLGIKSRRGPWTLITGHGVVATAFGSFT